jgi:AcrR family transcriptional regulator
MNAQPSDDLISYPERLMQGLALSVAEKGYVDTTIADIVRHARVSRRTFYQHFNDKKDCLLYSYRKTSFHTLEQVSLAVQASRQVTHNLIEHVREGVAIFLLLINSQPRYMQVLMTEILLAGQQGLVVRREVMNHFSQLIQLMVNTPMSAESRLVRPISPLLSTALVGAINELVLLAFEENRTDAFDELACPIEDMILSVIGLR